MDSPYRAALGGKGLGRFIWLKAFSRVEVDSHYRDAATGSIVRRKFTFIPTDEQDPGDLTASDRDAPQTTVRLCGYLPPYLEECPVNLIQLPNRSWATFSLCFSTHTVLHYR